MNGALIDKLQDIEKAASCLLHADIYFRDICEERIKKDLKLYFDLTAIQIFRREDRIIETVSGAGLAKKWAGRVGHYVTQDVELTDIQVDVYNSRKIEIITGKDPKGRFDEWMFDYYDHKNLSRAFIPIIIVRNKFGIVQADRLLSVKEVDFVEDCNGSCLSLMPKIRLKEGGPVYLEVIGTIEVGYQGCQKVNKGEAIAVFEYMVTEALEMRKRDVGFIFEMVLTHAVDITGADSANLFYAHDNIDNKKNAYLYQYGVGLEEGFKKYTPRDHGLGLRALEKRATMFSPDIRAGETTTDFMRNHGDLASQLEVKAISATPFWIKENHKEKEGLLYLHFKKEENPSLDQITAVEHFLEQIKNILEPTARLVAMEDQVRRQGNLLAMFQALVKDSDKNILELIANWTLNTFSADIVTIYEYDNVKRVFITPPCTAGRIFATYKMATEIEPGDVPMKFLLKAEENGYENNAYYSSNAAKERLLHREDKRSSRNENMPFQAREKVESVIGMVLCVNQQPVGEMFINYRRRKDFEECVFDKGLIEVLMPITALVLQNKRQMRQFKEELAGRIKLVIKEDNHPNLVMFKKGGCFYKRKYRIPRYQDGYFLGTVFTEQRLKDLREVIKGIFNKISPALRDITPDKDPEKGPELLLRRISRLIGGTRFCIFEMPDTMNANVYLEVGLAIGMNRPFVLLKHESAKISPLLEGPWFTAFSSFKGILESFIGSGAYIEISRAFDVCIEVPTVEDVCFCYCGTTETAKNLISDFNMEDFQSVLTDISKEMHLSFRTGEEESSVRVSTALEDAIRAVQSSKVCVFNIDKRMPGDNFLLLGMALALGKRCVLVKQKNSEIPSDLQGMRPVHIFDSYNDLRKVLSKEIR